MALLALLLLLQADPVLESVERLAGDVRRPTLWAPLAVTLSSARGFEGDVAVESEFRFSTARRVSVPAGGRVRVVLPALAPRTVRAGEAAFDVPPARRSAAFVVGLDERLAYARDLRSDGERLFVIVKTDDLRSLPAGAWEAFDLLLLADDAGLDLGGETSAVAPRREAAEAALGALRARPARIEAREDGDVWSLGPRDAWMPSKRTRTALFAAVYGFAGFGALALLARRGGRAAAAGVAGLAVVGTLVAALMPRGQLWVLGHACEVQKADGASSVWTLWHVGSAAKLETRVEFPSLVRPVFRSFEGAPQPFVLRVGEGGSAVEGLTLQAGEVAVFTASGRRPSRERPALEDAGALRQGTHRKLGRVAAGAAPPEGRPADFPADPEPRTFRRFMEGDVLYGREAGSGGAAEEVASPDLADARMRPRFVIRPWGR